MLDNRDLAFDALKLDVPRLCDRRFGIGADGLIVIQNHPELDFHMIYFNPDGSQSFCGNGSRCAVAFAQSLGMLKTRTTRFLSTDGEHSAEILDNGLVRLKMHDVEHFDMAGQDYIINTGSPHYIIFVDDVNDVDIIPEAHKVRYSDQYQGAGINVNFIQETPNGIAIRTYERGVEDETLSCGTGVTASALAYYLSLRSKAEQMRIPVSARGGNLSVEFQYSNNGFRELYLIGPAEKSFEGVIEHF